MSPTKATINPTEMLGQGGYKAKIGFTEDYAVVLAIFPPNAEGLYVIYEPNEAEELGCKLRQLARDMRKLRQGVRQ